MSVHSGSSLFHERSRSVLGYLDPMGQTGMAKVLIDAWPKFSYIDHIVRTWEAL